jgi:hypothetical protein
MYAMAFFLTLDDVDIVREREQENIMRTQQKRQRDAMNTKRRYETTGAVRGTRPVCDHDRRYGQ